MSVNIFCLYKRSLFLLLALFLTGLCLRCGGGGGGTNGLSDSSGITPIASEGCGDAQLDPDEGCDDGNWENSDGCNARCGLEVGEAICGNGVKENNECCDDGNLTNGDGCSSTCTLESSTQPPSAPVLAADPADGVTWAPTRLYLSWSASTDPDIGDTVVYDVYFVAGNGIPSDAVPYKGGIQDTKFIIQASTDNRSQFFPDQVTPIYLKPNETYSWKVCARDNHGATACSTKRTFNTDDSVVGWWRFDENPAGPVCSGGGAGETVCDYSGNNNHGIPHGSPIWLPPPNPALLGGALELDGVTNKVSVANDASLNPNSISILLKFKMNGKTGEQEIVDKRPGGGVAPAAYNLRVQGSGYPLTLRWVISESNGTEHFVDSVGTIANATNYYVVSSFDLPTGESRSYINGLSSAVQMFGALDRTTKSTVSLVLGDFSGPATFSLSATVDDIIILNRFIQSTEVGSNYNSTQ